MQDTIMERFDLEGRTAEFAGAEIRLCKKLPKSSINDSLDGQLVWLSGSNSANYREANDAFSSL